MHRLEDNANSGADTIGHGRHVPPPLLQMAGRGGNRDYKNSKQETDQTVLTITKALTKTTNSTFRAKKVDGHDQKKFFPALCAKPVPPPTFKYRSAPLNANR